MYKKQRGVTLIELLVALAIISAILAGIAQLLKDTGDDTRSALLAQQTKVVGDAAQAYIKDNYSAIMANATATTPALIRISDLIANNNLQAGFSTLNTFNQNVCVLVLEPTANNLIAAVVTEGGTTIDDVTLSGVVGYIGAAGGGIYSTATTTIRGAVGGYSLPVGNFANANHLGQKCNGTAGAVAFGAGHPVIALWFSDGDTTSAFLYRNSIPGRPELNRMNTDIDMNNNDIANAATIQLNTIVTNGTACTTNGVVAADSVGAVMSCQNLTWQPQGSAFWKDPVNTKAILDATTCNAATAWQTRIVKTPTVGTGPRGYTCNGTTWVALAVNDSGNLTAAGTVTVGKVQVSDVVVENTACSPNGLVARDSVGLILSCQSSIWKKASGSGGILSSSNYQNLLGGKTGSGTLTCTGTSPGTVAASITVASDASYITVSAGGSNASCGEGYTCNGYGCTSPNGVYALVSQTSAGVRYQKAQYLGIYSYFTINLNTTGWSGNKSGSPSYGGTAVLNGVFTN